MTRTEPSNAKLPGTQPEGARDEREAAARVQEMFARIAPRYDFLNHLLSFSFDRVWRRRAAKHFLGILRQPDARVLDVCCGTGDLALALDSVRTNVLRYAARNRSPLIGSDFVLPMLVRARAKVAQRARRVMFAAADALNLPYPNASFDLVTSAFGFRNLANYELGLREFARILRPGGEMGILEFSEPASGALAALFRFYFQRILPRVGGALSGSADAYSYLPASVVKFPSPQEMIGLIERCGFAGAGYQSWNFGSVLLYWAQRSETARGREEGLRRSNAASRVIGGERPDSGSLSAPLSEDRGVGDRPSFPARACGSYSKAFCRKRPASRRPAFDSISIRAERSES
jgi:demethylmenaquinone methyltransferase / 2-methoxy-6-polyprenyl-1,4-benzoquinol methylase